MESESQIVRGPFFVFFDCPEFESAIFLGSRRIQKRDLEQSDFLIPCYSDVLLYNHGAVRMKIRESGIHWSKKTGEGQY